MSFIPHHYLEASKSYYILYTVHLVNVNYPFKIRHCYMKLLRCKTGKTAYVVEGIYSTS